MDSIIIQKSESLAALNKSEIDVQIATAKQYPRVVTDSINRISYLATIDKETAEECFYSLRRKGANGASESVIEGPSVRLAEIIAASWGNLRVQSQVIANDGKFITARGICHDLETNVAVSCEVQRKITDRNGRTFSEDMQVVTGNAAGAIAFRNAVFKVVPKAVINRALTDIKQAAMGAGDELIETRSKMLRYFASMGVTEPMVLNYLEVESADAITAEMVTELRGTKNAIKEGMATVKELFIDPYNAKSKSDKETRRISSAADKVSAALDKQNAESNDLPIGNLI